MVMVENEVVALVVVVADEVGVELMLTVHYYDTYVAIEVRVVEVDTYIHSAGVDVYLGIPLKYHLNRNH